MNRTEMNRVARGIIAQVAEEHGLDRCEKCGGTFGLAPAHKNRREFYSTAEELADYRQWICLCQPCHAELDDRNKTTKEESDALFDRLRP